MENKKKYQKKITKIEEMSKEQIRQAIQKKRECTTKAQQIVETLLENCVSEDYFLNILYEINQSHLDDVIEERAILHLCGYPICNNPIYEKDIPKQKYRISMKTNKVYDISVRKNFCSNSCYKAALHIKKQMLTSPLWFREYEEKPEFCLLPLNTVGSMGEEIDLAIVDKLEMCSDSKQPFTSIHEFANASFTDIHKENIKASDSVIKKRDTFETIVENNVNRLESDNVDKVKGAPECSSAELNKRKNTTNQSINSLNIVGEIIEKPEKKIDPILTTASVSLHSSARKETQKKVPSVTVIAIEVEKCLAEWFTLDTMLFLFGEDKVKEMIADKGECIQEYMKNYSKSIFYNSNAYDQYQVLCRKLNMLELEEQKFDTQIAQREMKPLPDYSILKEESKNITLKVKAFLAGETEITENESQELNPATVTNENLTQLPLVDRNAQNALRRKIVCQHLNKVLPDLLRSLGLLTLTISSDVRLLVNTFRLKANNVMFKPIQWTLIAIIIIHLLSLRDQRLQYLLQQQTAYQHMQLLLLSYKQDGGYVDRLVSWLTDIDRLLDTNDTQLTVE